MQHRPDAPYLFISYASADRTRVLPVVDALERAGVPVWIDREGIHGGANYGREIAEAIKGSAALVLMASSLSLASRNVKQEIAVAWEYERPYLPLLLVPVAIPDDLKCWLTAAQWVEVLDTPEGEWLPQVLTALRPFGIAPTAPAHEEARLAGRDRELTVLREKLNAAEAGKGGLVLIGGEAGIGKTTLVEAALRLAEREGFALLEGHCFDLAETPPYGPFIDLFAHLPALASPPPLPDAFAARHRRRGREPAGPLRPGRGLPEGLRGSAACRSAPRRSPLGGRGQPRLAPLPCPCAVRYAAARTPDIPLRRGNASASSLPTPTDVAARTDDR